MVSEHLKASSQFSHGSEGGLQLDRLALRLKRHIFLIAGITSLVASAAVAKALTEAPIYSAEFELLTPPETLETQIISTINPGAISNQSKPVGTGSLDETKLKVITSPSSPSACCRENSEHLSRSLLYRNR